MDFISELKILTGISRFAIADQQSWKICKLVISGMPNKVNGIVNCRLTKNWEPTSAKYQCCIQTPFVYLFLIPLTALFSSVKDQIISNQRPIVMQLSPFFFHQSCWASHACFLLSRKSLGVSSFSSMYFSFVFYSSVKKSTHY